jgi:glycerol uptake facilitator-like aquaporin
MLNPTAGDSGAFICEITCTFFFILIILMVKNPITAPSKEGYLCCWTVGIQLLCCICLCAGHTGAALNPAVGVAVLVYDAWRQSEFSAEELSKHNLTKVNYLSKIWIYTLGPYLGGLLAGIFHHYHVWSTQCVLHEQLEIAHAIVYHDDKKMREEVEANLIRQ